MYIYTWRVSGLIILPIGWLQATPAELFTKRTLHSIEMLPDLSYQPIVSWWFSNVFTPFSFRGTFSKSLLTGNDFGMLPTNHWLILFFNAGPTMAREGGYVDIPSSLQIGSFQPNLRRSPQIVMIRYDMILLMAEILHQLIGSFSHYL